MHLMVLRLMMDHGIAFGLVSRGGDHQGGVRPREPFLGWQSYCILFCVSEKDAGLFEGSLGHATVEGLVVELSAGRWSLEMLLVWGPKIGGRSGCEAHHDVLVVG